MERLLYEYDHQKPELTDEFLEHHGIIGMKWGHKNGPPYPLSSDISTGKKLKSTIGGIKKKLPKSKKQKQQEKYSKLSKEEIIETKNVKAMDFRSKEFSDQEINKVLNRIGTEKRLKDMAKGNSRIDALKNNKALKTIAITSLIALPIAISRARQGVIPGYNYHINVMRNLPKDFGALYGEIFKKVGKVRNIIGK